MFIGVWLALLRRIGCDSGMTLQPLACAKPYIELAAVHGSATVGTCAWFWLRTPLEQRRRPARDKHYSGWTRSGPTLSFAWAAVSNRRHAPLKRHGRALGGDAHGAPCNDRNGDRACRAEPPSKARLLHLRPAKLFALNDC